MAIIPPVQQAPYDVEEKARDRGWVIFAGTLLWIVGFLNFIYGTAAVSGSGYYTRHAEYVLSDLETWGWFLIALGAVQVLAAASVWNGTAWGRWVGVASASVNAIVQLLAIAGAPLLSLALFAVDILAIHGLIVHGGRRVQPEAEA